MTRLLRRENRMTKFIIGGVDVIDGGNSESKITVD